MANLVKLGAVSEMPSPNEAREFECANRTICVANVDGQLCAMRTTQNGTPKNTGRIGLSIP